MNSQNVTVYKATYINVGTSDEEQVPDYNELLGTEIVTYSKAIELYNKLDKIESEYKTKLGFTVYARMD